MQASELSHQFLEVIPKTMRSIRANFREAAQTELTIPQFRALNLIHRGTTSNAELAGELGVSAPAMSRMIDGLVKRGFVAREVSNEDRRKIHLSLSPLGRKSYESFRTHTQKSFEKLFSTLDDSRKKALQDGFSILQELFESR